MEKLNLEQLAQDYSDGKVSIKDSSLKLMEYVFLHKNLFGLKCLDEDDFLDFLIFQLPKFNKIFLMYDKEIGTFFSYLQFTLRKSLSIWRRNLIRKHIFDDEISPLQIMQNEEQSEKYELEAEGIELIQKENEQYSNTLSYNISSSKKEEETYRFEKQKNDAKRIIKFQNLQKQAILILALKSCYYLDDEIINKVCAYTGIDKKDFLRMQKILGNELLLKVKRRDSCIKCRNNSFYFHRKYLLELQKISPLTSWSKLIQCKYNKQTKTWISKNKKLHRKDYYVSASNCAVGKILNLDARHVKYVINKANDNVDLFRPKQYHISHENISCDGQSE